MFEAQKAEETNPNCKYFIKVRKEIKELVIFFEELKQKKELE